LKNQRSSFLGDEELQALSACTGTVINNPQKSNSRQTQCRNKQRPRKNSSQPSLIKTTVEAMKEMMLLLKNNKSTSGKKTTDEEKKKKQEEK
jgi:hypothetical protein